MNGVYYDEINPYGAAWLRNLIVAGLIESGDVDERSIVDVNPDDLAGYQQVHLFAGIGGWPYALKLAGWEGPCWTASCPCQPFSSAGQRKEIDDDRDLWPALFRLIEACRPPVIFGEQVAASGVVGPSQEMQSVRRRKGAKRIQAAQQGRISLDLPGLREHEHSRNEALEIRAQAGLSAGAPPDSSWVCLDERSEETGDREEHSIRAGLAGYSRKDRSGNLRGNGASLQSGRTQILECAVAGSDSAVAGLYKTEHTRGSVRAQHHGKQLGIGEDIVDCGRDQGETVRERVERLIAENLRTAERSLTWLDRIRSDLAGAGYTVGACIIPACAVNAPHIRQRLFWVAHSAVAGRCTQPGRHDRTDGRSEAEPGRLRHAGGSVRLGDTNRRGQSGLADTRLHCGANRDTESIRDADGSRTAGGVGDAFTTGFQEQRGNGEIPRSEGTTGSGQTSIGAGASTFWSGAEWLPCLDGKARRIESGIQPLAHGVPNRVGRLRAYGNAIVPQVAAEFVAAFMEAACCLSRPSRQVLS